MRLEGQFPSHNLFHAGVNNVPQSVNKGCGEGGDCFPVLIHTGVFDHSSANRMLLIKL